MLKVVMVSGHACIRVQKMMMPLIDRGHEVHLIAKSIPPFYEWYSTMCQTVGTNHYLKAIDVYAKTADVFHVHNEPSWFVSAIKERCDVPVVLDVHDSWLARLTAEECDALEEKTGKPCPRIYTEERNNFQLADALVFPSDPFGNLVSKEFGLTQPSLTLPSMLPKMLYRYNTKEHLGGLVYEGRIDLKSSYEDTPKRSGFKYCDYEELAKEAHRIGIDFHTYTTKKSDEFRAIYDDIAWTHEGRPIDQLLASVSRHDWGLVGNIFPTSEWNVAFPNKLFEYIGANVPVVAINAPHCAKFITENGFGIAVDSLEELAARWGEHEAIRNSLIKNRMRASMDAHIYKLEKLYQEVIARG